MIAQFDVAVVVVSDAPALTILRRSRAAGHRHRVLIVRAAETNLPLRASVADAVFCYLGSMVSTSHIAERMTTALEECHRVVHDDGRLFTSWAQGSVFRRALTLVLDGWRTLRKRAPTSRGSIQVSFAVSTMISRAGFTSRRLYYVRPSLADPREYLPACRRALLAATHGALRRGLVQIGAHRLLFPERFMVAGKRHRE